MSEPLSLEQRVRQGLAAQGFMRHVGAEVVTVGEGHLVLAVNRRPELLQQHGFFHGGLIGFLIDNTTTAAAGTVSRGGGVLTAEYKLNILAPADGDRLVCTANVIKPGRMLTVVEGRVESFKGDGPPKLIAVALATIANLPEVRPAAA